MIAVLVVAPALAAVTAVVVLVAALRGMSADDRRHAQTVKGHRR